MNHCRTATILIAGERVPLGRRVAKPEHPVLIRLTVELMPLEAG